MLISVRMVDTKKIVQVDRERAMVLLASGRAEKVEAETETAMVTAPERAMLEKPRPRKSTK